MCCLLSETFELKHLILFCFTSILSVVLRVAYDLVTIPTWLTLYIVIVAPTAKLFNDRSVDLAWWTQLLLRYQNKKWCTGRYIYLLQHDIFWYKHNDHIFLFHNQGYVLREVIIKQYGYCPKVREVSIPESKLFSISFCSIEIKLWWRV